MGPRVNTGEEHGGHESQDGVLRSGRSGDSPERKRSPPGGWPTPRSLYLHVPFCRHRCGYCNFSVLAGRDDLQDRFLDAIESEVRGVRARTGSESPLLLDTLYLGGGTPTQLTDARLQRLMRILRENVTLSPGAEFTCEANPEDVDVTVLSRLKEAGVNRISLGVQSFHDSKLQTLQRSHSRDHAIGAIELAAKWIGNVTIDLIFAVPGETLADWRQDLECAVSLPIRHVSTYSLTYEKGTQFWSRRKRGGLTPVDEAVDIRMYRASRQVLGDACFDHYEISSFAMPGYRSQHNSVYWNGYGWYALGPGAARFVEGRRHVNHRSPTTYIKRMLETGDATAEHESISLEQHAREIAAFGIRQIDGIDLAEVDRRVGYEFSRTIESVLESCEQSKWLCRNGSHVKLTSRGLLFADSVESMILQ
ncbi:radical SAM family heme chaperone HemW [Rhodopirellula sallentina]|uniref:Heme chaperone HemW n=1 Tax=Rhodopirellula sallentina SM41 TaxID=1263870 RepID=M5TUI6_9BACT|nr:radical SAM family heme chaperone HemW [Rhodopirellula sallentina]EMI52857.1 Putative oxygen-independent coproporphyrinogen III oxidase [Rhodopirellula sallentina SM41]